MPTFNFSTDAIRYAARLAVLSCAAATAGQAQAQPATAAGAAGDVIVITATRSQQRVDKALAEITVIDANQIQAADGRTLAELLSGASGVQVWSNGGLGKTASVSLRGLESRHTLLMIDGIRYTSATVGSPSWDNLAPDSMERIEIVRGPLSALYGSDAVGGVIQIFTRTGQAGLQPYVRITAGSESYAAGSAGLGFGVGPVDGQVGIQHRRNNGFSATHARVPFGSHNPDNDGFEQTSMNARLGLRLGEWRAQATVLKAQVENRYDDGPGADSRAELRTEVLALRLAGPVVGSWRTSLSLGQSKDELDTLATASAFTPLGTIGTRLHQLTWENQVDTPVGTAVVLAEWVEQEVARPGTPFAVSERATTGVAAGLNGEAAAHSWQVSVRRDRNSQFGLQTHGAVGYGYELLRGLRATATMGTSFVAPSFNQLYFPNFGNPHLLPEEGRHAEYALVWRQGAVTSRLAYFDNRIRGYISSGPLPTNLPRVKVDGISANVQARTGAWTWAGGLDSINPVNATEGSSNQGRILPRRVQDTARLSVDRHAGAWTLGATLLGVGHRFDDTANTTRLGGYTTLDLRAQWALGRDWLVSARLNNVADKNYETVLGYNQPGREAYISLRWQPRS